MAIAPIPTNAGKACGLTLIFRLSLSSVMARPLREIGCGDAGKERYGERLPGSGTSPKMISWHRCKMRWQMRNGRGFVCRVGVRSRRAACMNQNVCLSARSDGQAEATYQHGRVGALFRSLDDERFQRVRFRWICNEQMAAVSARRLMTPRRSYIPYLRPVAFHLFRAHTPHAPTQVVRNTDTV